MSTGTEQKDSGIRNTGIPPELSERERQVLAYLGSGLNVSKIAAATGLSVKTVSTYRVRVLEKLHLDSTAALMRYAILNKIEPQ